MATRYGHEIASILVSHCGWKWAESDPEVYGDQWVIDPETGISHSPYEAWEIQECRVSPPGEGF